MGCLLTLKLKKSRSCVTEKHEEVSSTFHLILFTQPPARAGYDTRSIFKRSLTGLNSEFSFSKTSCLTKAEEPSQPYYLPIAGRRIIGFIPFPRVLVLCEMQSVSSRIWSRVAVFISYDDNNYTTGILLGRSCLDGTFFEKDEKTWDSENLDFSVDIRNSKIVQGVGES